jgi:hypothetical protein
MAFPITGSGGGDGGTRSVEPAPSTGGGIGDTGLDHRLTGSGWWQSPTHVPSVTLRQGGATSRGATWYTLSLLIEDHRERGRPHGDDDQEEQSCSKGHIPIVREGGGPFPTRSRSPRRRGRRVPVLTALTAWGDPWVAPAHGPPIRFRHRCGEIVSPVVVCPEPITLDDVTALPGPGGRAAPGTRLLGTRVG